MVKSHLLGAVGIVVVGCVAVAVAAQAPAPPAFEVASVKSADPNQAESISRASDRLTVVNQSVQKLILWAFHISDDRLLNQPGWINSARYDVVAKAPTADLPVGRVNEMTQSLLAERFNLAVHWETRDGQRYALRLDRGGPKVRVIDAGPGPRPQNPFRMDRNGHLTGLQVSATMLATVLSDQLGRFVADETGLDGVFDFTLDWAPDATQQSTDAALGASLFTAVQEQLGLKLESTRGPVDVLVIDHVERPTPD